MQDIKKKTVVSMLSLFLQSGYSAGLGLVANLIITILLTPKIFGIYITVLSMISLLNYFSDIGLAASLVQKKEIDAEDVRTVFSVQQLLIITAVLIGFLASDAVQRFYQLPATGVYLYWALLFSFFLSSLKTIPSIFLERKIHFQKIVIVQVIENTVFYLTVIVLAIAKFDLTSFTVAVLVRAVAGLAAIYVISPWKPQIGISFARLKGLLKFGLPFQANSFMALLKDDLMTLYLSKAVGFTGMGYIGWAKKWAEAPIRIIMDNISRVLFPVIARIQHETDKVGRLVDKILVYQTILLAPVISGAIVLMSVFVEIVPRYNKWAVALPLFYLFIIASFFSSYSSPFTNLFNALGRIKISFYFMVFWTAGTWILTPLLTRFLGYYGFPLTQLVLSFAFVVVVKQAKQLVKFHFWRSVYRPTLAAVIMGLALAFINLFLLNSLVDLLIMVMLGALIYVLVLNWIFRVNLVKLIKELGNYS
ncbi:oligosaccharide flippase family protein [Patescibacteria group bacterium]|nr:oligosaccharide flippase family protein [Patescibacteria group bacterium]MCL5091449.1 oligosaccharide flippase family protein [Patescibacteria group bacterium]